MQYRMGDADGFEFLSFRGTNAHGLVERKGEREWPKPRPDSAHLQDFPSVRCAQGSERVGFLFTGIRGEFGKEG